MTKKYLFLLSFLLVSLVSAMAQPKSFSRKPDVFITELTTFIKSANNSEFNNTASIFKERWDSAAFSEPNVQIIIRLNNEMLQNKLEVPSFAKLQKTILAGEKAVKKEKFDQWIKALLPSLQSGNKTYINFLEASDLLFTDNTLFANPTKKWVSDKGNYEFEFDKNRVRITFKDIKLSCIALADKIEIFNTSGSYYLDEGVWEGFKGKMNWDRVGFGADNVFVDILGNYKINLEKAEIDIDTVLHTNKGFLDAPILGSFKDRASSAVRLEEASLQKSSFPQFESFRQDIQLGSYLEGRIRFKGGYAIKGSEILARGSEKFPSSIEIDYKSKIRVRATSEYFSLKESRIVGGSASITIFSDSGTIYHPNARFDLNIENKLLLITRGKEGLQRAPFFDSDKEVEIFVDNVFWKLDLPKIEFKMGNPEAAAIIESNNFYKEIRYEKITRGMMAYHPLSKMRDFVVKNKKREFTFTEYAAWMNVKPVNLKVQIIELADLGYIFFNPAADSIKIRKKLDLAVLAHLGVMDYDVIRFSSVIASRSNAYLDLINNVLQLEGIQGFRFSDSQRVYAFPHEQMVSLKSKRRMEFGGRLTAGKFDLYGNKFNFDYFDFTISSEQIDSMRIYTEDFEGKNQLIGVKSVLRDINGILEIDKSTNKSGLADFPEYPRFTSKKGAIIAYDKPHIHNGAYTKDRFKFEVDPFVVENMNNYQAKDLKFAGTFRSGGIVPDFRHEVGIMSDYSLGFEKDAPPGGYPMYGGKGQGDITVRLSEEGFQARGTINYQGAELKSSDIVMMPDSTIAKAESYNIKENTVYPNLFARDVLTRWMPNKDSMYINTNNHTVTVLRDRQLFQGNLVQTSKQLAGNGELAWDNAKLWSSDMKFKPNEVKANVSKVEIGAISGDKIAFASDNLFSDVNFTTRIAEFKANEKGKFTELPYNAYASSMDEYKWDMNAQTIELKAGPGLAADKSLFVSRNPEQKGLSFQSTKALFDMKSGLIFAENVPYIDVADSRIYPFEGKLTIEQNAKMRTLEKSKMLASRTNKYHEIFDASIYVGGRYALGGSGFYHYKDKHNTKQVIYFDKMTVKDDSTVVAKGFIKDSISFTVSPKIAYKGSTELWSSEKDIKFNGYVKPLHTFTQFPSTWFRYTDQPDPSNVIVQAHVPKNEDKRTLALAVSIANDSTNIYPSFFNFKRNYADLELTKDTGIMYYDEQENTFYVGDSNKLLNGSLNGSYLSFNEGSREIYSEGKIDFGFDLSEHFSGVTAGNMRKGEQDSSFFLEMTMALNMTLPDECYQRLIAVINANTMELRTAQNNTEFTRKAFSEFVEDKKFKRLFSKVEESNELRPQGELDRDVLLTRMSLHYSPTRKAFISQEKVQIATIKGTQINQQVDSRLIVSRKRSGTRFTWYLQVTKYDWFYFDYYMGSITVASTDKEFNDAVITKGAKMSKGKFRIKTASPRTVTNLLSKMDLEEE